MSQIIYPITHLPPVIDIGKQTEKGVKRIGFDVHEWLDDWPGMRVSVQPTRPGEGSSYIAETDLVGSVLFWLVGATDTEIPGGGTVEIVGVGENERKLSATCRTIVNATTTSTTTEIPEPGRPWLDQVIMAGETAKAEAKDAATSAQEAAQAASAAGQYSANADAMAHAAAQSATSAGASAASASNSASLAEQSKQEAVRQADNAEGHAKTAQTWAGRSETYAGNAQTAANAAETAKSGAAASAQEAAQSAMAAKSSATEAGQHYDAVAQQVAKATTAADSASKSAQSASQSANEAASSKSSAATSASKAATSAQSAATYSQQIMGNISKAELHANNAKAYKEGAETAAAAAEASAKSIGDAEKNAGHYANQAANSNAEAASYANSAFNSEQAAAKSARDAATAKADATNSANTASSKAQTAATSAQEAGASAQQAAKSAENAAVSAESARQSAEKIPVTDKPFQQLVTGPDGVGVWDDRLAYSIERVETVVNMPETSMAWGEDGVFGMLNPWAVEVEVGKTYKVLYNGTEYSLTGVEDRSGVQVILGDAKFIDSLNPDGDPNAPFGILCSTNRDGADNADVYAEIFTKDSPDACVMKITHEQVETYKKIIPNELLDTGLFVIQTDIQNGTQIATKTYAEIGDAIDAGKVCVFFLRSLGVLNYARKTSDGYMFATAYPNQVESRPGIGMVTAVVKPDSTVSVTAYDPIETPNPNSIIFSGAVSGKYDGREQLNLNIPKVPTTLPSPFKLKLKGAVAAEYDGSGEVTVEIPAGGGGGSAINSVTILPATDLMYTEEMDMPAFAGMLQVMPKSHTLFRINYNGALYDSIVVWQTNAYAFGNIAFMYGESFGDIPFVGLIMPIDETTAALYCVPIDGAEAVNMSITQMESLNPGVCIVNITCDSEKNSEGEYNNAVKDKTYAEIETAYALGNLVVCRLMVNGQSGRTDFTMKSYEDSYSFGFVNAGDVLKSQEYIDILYDDTVHITG